MESINTKEKFIEVVIGKMVKKRNFLSLQQNLIEVLEVEKD